MPTLRAEAHCAHRGATVGAGRRLPSAAWERWAVGPEVGCNQLRCGRCGERVRQAPGFELAAGPGPDAPALFAAPDWRRFPGLAVGGPGRLYACACAWHLENAHSWLAHQGRDPLAPVLMWACGGHPAPPWPLSLDGLVVGDATDVTALSRDVLCGQRAAPADVPAELHRAWELELLLDAVPGWSDRVFSAALAALDAADAPTIRRALDLLRHHPERVPTDGALARWQRLATVVDPWAQGRSLGVAFAEALAARVRLQGGDSAAAQAGRALVQAGCEAGPLKFALRSGAVAAPQEKGG